MIERRALQLAVALACLIPIVTGLSGVLRGATMFHLAVVPRDLDSHYRYLSGIFLMLGLAFASTVPAIERAGARFQLLGLMVISGGIARALSWAMVGAPGNGHRLGLVMELIVVPLLMLWQARVARRAVGGNTAT